MKFTFFENGERSRFLFFKEQMVADTLETSTVCQTPQELLESQAFRLEWEAQKHQLAAEAGSHSDLIRRLQPEDFIAIIEGGGNWESGEREAVIAAFDQGFHNYSDSHRFSRLTRLADWAEARSANGELKREALERAIQLTQTIQETQDALHQAIGSQAERLAADAGETDLTTLRQFTKFNPAPKISAVETSAEHISFPGKFQELANIPLVVGGSARTGINYDTEAERRAKPFGELDADPSMQNFEHGDWTGVPLNIGGQFIICYIHKATGAREMEAGLLNLFPLADLEAIEGKQPDGLYFFGDPNAREDELGYYQDESGMLIGMVPDHEIHKYFGYIKKGMLTLHNVALYEKEDLPLHCGAMEYVVEFDEAGNPSIAQMHVLADDMGSAAIDDTTGKIMFRGTETGAFACLNGFSEEAKRRVLGTEVGYNETKSVHNARQIVPVTSEEKATTPIELDGLFHMNNYTPKGTDQKLVDDGVDFGEFRAELTRGRRVGSGSVGKRGGWEESHMANPFPPVWVKQGEEVVAHDPEMLKKVKAVDDKFLRQMEALRDKGEFFTGVCYSQLMAGVDGVNEDTQLEAAGWELAHKEDIEVQGPQRLGRQFLEFILSSAKQKRARVGGEPQRVSISVALIGDSRTGKSETMEALADMLALEN